MKRITALLCALLINTGLAAEDGLVRLKSPYSVDDTLDRFEQAVGDKGMRVFARINHAAGAAVVGLELAPIQLLIFGNPKIGTVLIQDQPTAAIDLPLKALAWQDGDGQVWLAYNDPAYLVSRHAIENRELLVERMQKALAAFADTATAP